MTAPSPPPSAEDRVRNTLHVRNLNFKTEGRRLGDAFKKYGAIDSVRIITRENQYGETVSRGFGFVQFKTSDGYEKALSEPSPIEVDGRALQLSAARPPERRKRDTAFIGHVAVGTTEQQIREAFNGYTISAVRIIQKEGLTPFAFVQFTTEEQQTAAVRSNRTLTINGSECVVRYARPRFAPRYGRGPPRGPRRAAQANRAPTEGGTAPTRGGRGARGPRRGARRAGATGGGGEEAAPTGK